MTFEAWIMLAILIVLFGFLVWNKLPAWIVFVGALTVTMTPALALERELLEGSASPAVATAGVLFDVTAGMCSTGAITLIADKFIGLPRTLSNAQVKILPPVAISSAFLQLFILARETCWNFILPEAFNSPRRFAISSIPVSSVAIFASLDCIS